VIDLSSKLTNIMYKIHDYSFPSLESISEGLSENSKENKTFENIILEFEKIDDFVVQVDFNVDVEFDYCAGDYWTQPYSSYYIDLYLDSVKILYQDRNNTIKKVDIKSPIYQQVKKQLENHYEV
jgi:hypothetical protein